MFQAFQRNALRFFHIFRDDGTVIAVTSWQWLIEFVTSIITAALFSINGSSRLVDHTLFLILMAMAFIVLPSLTFFADASFRSALHSHGFARAFWQALTQKYG